MCWNPTSRRRKTANEKTPNKRNNKPYGPEYDDIYDLRADAYPETGIHHLSSNCYTFPKLLDEERFALAAH
jgi:hypothetical protein